MPRDQSQKRPKPRHQPLLVDLHNDANPKLKLKRPRQTNHSSDSDSDDHEQLLDVRSSKRLLLLAKMQQQELEAGSQDEDDARPDSELNELSRQWQTSKEDNSDSEMEHEKYDSEEEITIDEEDIAILEKLHPTSSDNRHTLADVILSKLGSTALPTSPPSGGPEAGLDPRVVELFEKAGASMRGTGGIPKVIKMLPAFPLWKRYLALAYPSQWSPFAFRKVTNMFISSMKPEQATFYLRYVLLPAARENIEQERELNVHYYEALMRALYKPAAFVKGVLFPLLDDGCTLKEAAIFGSILSKKTIPSVHLGAAILHIASKDFSGPRALIIRVLLDKRKDLPYKVLDELVFHFVRVSNWAQASKQPLPVLWHQSLLVLAQRYSPHLTSEQKDALLDVVRVNFHHQIGPEIRRELVATPARSQVVGQDIDMA